MNAGGVWAINPHRSMAGRRNSSKNPLPPTTTSDAPALREREEEESSDDKARLERAQEIVSWFSTRKEIRRAVKRVFRNLTVEEDKRLAPNGFTTPTGAPVSSLAALLWAMEETESGNPAQRAKWWGFRSCRRFPAGPEEFLVGTVMAIPTPGTRRVPISIKDSEEEMESEAEELEPVLDLGGSSGGGKKKQKAQLHRRSPRFL
ncbi:hypothetical protein VPH35_056145 [Triticum aestivum]